MIVKNSIIFAIAALAKGVFSFAMLALYTRLLSPDAFGDYAIVIAIINVTDMLAFMWLRQSIMRHIHDENRQDDTKILGNAALLYAVASVLTLAIGSLSWLAGFDAIFDLVVVIIIAEGWANLMILLARLRLKLGLFLTLSILKPALSLLIGALLILSGMHAMGAVIGLLIACIAVALGGAITLPDMRAMRRAPMRPHISKVQITQLLSFGLPLIIGLSVQSIVKVSDRLLLEGIIGGDITGFYAAAQDIPYKMIMIITAAIHLAIYPLALKALEKGTQAECQAQCQAQLEKNFIILIAILTPTVIGIMSIAAPLSAVFLGAEFRPFASVFIPVFAGIAALACITQYYFMLAFNLSKRNDMMILPTIFAALINLGIGFVLIPHTGALGAMMGSVLAYLYMLIASLVLGRRVLRMPIPQTPTLKIIAAGFVMGIGVFILNPSATIIGLLSASLLGITIYVSMVMVLNPLNCRDYAVAYLKTKIKTKKINIDHE